MQPPDDGDNRVEEKKQRRGRRRHDDFSESDEDEPANGARFRFNARKCFLTYPRCPTKEAEFLGCFPIDRERIKTCFAKQELHSDGTPHLHAFVEFNKKLDLTNPNCFDILAPDGTEDPNGIPNLARYHPNIKREFGPSHLERTYEYLCKNGERPVELTGKADLYRFSKDFCKVYRDRECWLSYRRSSAQPNPQWPINGPSGQVWGDPQTAGKQRNAWIWGPANVGKTTWLENNVYCYKNYKVGNTRYPFDNYADEQIVVYDDVTPIARHLLVLGNTSNYPRPCPGDTRYHQRHIPPKIALWTVVCTNKSIEQEFGSETEELQEAIKARFVEVQLLPQ